MYQIGNQVQFEYTETYLHGVIVPYIGQSTHGHSYDSYLIKLEGFVDPIRDPAELSYYGWSSPVVDEPALYLWIDHTEPSLAYYQPPPPPRPVSPVFYMVKEVT